MDILHVHTKRRKLDTLEQMEIYKHTKTQKRHPKRTDTIQITHIII